MNGRLHVSELVVAKTRRLGVTQQQHYLLNERMSCHCAAMPCREEVIGLQSHSEFIRGSLHQVYPPSLKTNDTFRGRVYEATFIQFIPMYSEILNVKSCDSRNLRSSNFRSKSSDLNTFGSFFMSENAEIHPVSAATAINSVVSIVPSL